MPLNAAYADEIVQEDNSTYQLSFRFPTSDPLWEKLKEETFLTADDLHGEQDFVIFEVEKKHGYIQVYANQVFYEVYFSTCKNVRPFTYDGIEYIPLPKTSAIEIPDMNNGVRVTSLERTVIDSIFDMDKIAGLEEILRCLELIPSLNEEKLLDVLEGYSKKQLYQKVGYILEFYKKDLSLSKDFFLKCISCSSSSKTYLSQEIRDNIFHPKWLLYAPKDLKQLINKGVEYDDVI